MSVMAMWTFALLALSSAANVGDAPFESVPRPRSVANAVSSAVASARDEALKGSAPFPTCSAGSVNVTFGPSHDPTHAVLGGGPAFGASCGGPGVSFGPGFRIHLLERGAP
jgi:hypothetical protein